MLNAQFDLFDPQWQDTIKRNHSSATSMFSDTFSHILPLQYLPKSDFSQEYTRKQLNLYQRLLNNVSLVMNVDLVLIHKYRISPK